MGIWNSTLVYVGARTLLAGAMIALLLRRRVGVAYAGGQIVSDLTCAAFLLAYVNADIREDVGWLAVPLLLFVLYWEATRFRENRHAAPLGEDEGTWVDSALRTYSAVWTIGFVFPAVLAGGFLLFDVLYPSQWPFPNPRPGLVCAPQQFKPGSELRLRMSVPHGGELSVFTPNGRALVVVPFVAKGSQPAGTTFQWIEHYTIRTDTITGRASPMSQRSACSRIRGSICSVSVKRPRCPLHGFVACATWGRRPLSSSQPRAARSPQPRIALH